MRASAWILVPLLCPAFASAATFPIPTPLKLPSVCTSRMGDPQEGPAKFDAKTRKWTKWVMQPCAGNGGANALSCYHYIVEYTFEYDYGAENSVGRQVKMDEPKRQPDLTKCAKIQETCKKVKKDADPELFHKCAKALDEIRVWSGQH